MMAADIDPGEVQPMLALDAELDRVEGEMLAFMEGEIRQAELMKVLGAASLAIAGEIGGMDGARVLITPGEQENAVCLSGPPAAARAGRYDAAWSLPMARSDKPAGKLCLWWHEGAADRAAELCVTRGMPARAGAAAFFLGDWQGCGWTARSSADYRLG
jgi:hypothetical protein